MLFLDASLYILMYCIEGFSWGVLGITHPWIGKKWPCWGGLKLDLNDESLLSWLEEGERVGCMGPYLSTHALLLLRKF